MSVSHRTVLIVEKTGKISITSALKSNVIDRAEDLRFVPEN